MFRGIFRSQELQNPDQWVLQNDVFFFLLLIRGEISMKNFPQKKMKPNKMVIIRQPKDDLGAMTNALEF